MDENLKNIPMPLPLGGVACLNFINTIEYRHSDHPVEFLHGYLHVAVCAHDYGLITEAELANITADAQNEKLQAEQAYEQALAFREALYRLFRAQVDGAAMPDPDKLLFDRILREGMGHRGVLTTEEGKFTWGWRGINLGLPLWAVALSAADLLTSDQLGRVRQCPNCNWLFVDNSRNGKRRWCSMDYCGSQVKSRRQYERKRVG